MESEVGCGEESSSLFRPTSFAEFRPTSQFSVPPTAQFQTDFNLRFNMSGSLLRLQIDPFTLTRSVIMSTFCYLQLKPHRDGAPRTQKLMSRTRATKVTLVIPKSRSDYSFACFEYYQEIPTFQFLPVRSFNFTSPPPTPSPLSKMKCAS